MVNGAVLLAAIAAFAQTPPERLPDTPRSRPFDALSELKKLCVVTDGDPKAAAAAAIAAGYRRDRSGDYSVGNRRFSSVLTLSTGHFDIDGEGRHETPFCIIMVSPGRRADVLAVKRWIGVNKPDSEGYPYYMIEDAKGRRVSSSKNLKERRKALAGGALRIVEIEPLHFDGVMVSYSKLQAIPVLVPPKQ
jgi:hypothetical protein